MAVISFHSLEDRVVKQFITAASRPEAAYARLPLRESEMPQPVLLALRDCSQLIVKLARTRAHVLQYCAWLSARSRDCLKWVQPLFPPAPIATSASHKKGAR